ncbi:MAG TPA: hypothetical protein PLM70_08045, partial [Bacteroidales bacterium]|nr:hypothetical protein [Bacteroidales bacterium]
MMRKITKKILHIFLKILLIFVALDLLIVLLVFTPPIQKLIVNKVTSSISEVSKSKFIIQKIYITPTFRIKAKEVYIKDHHGNNMISAHELSAKLNIKKFSFHSIYLKDIIIKKGEFILRTYKGENTINLNQWIYSFGRSTSTQHFILHLKDVKLIKSRFAVINDNTRTYSKDNTIDYGFFEFKNINATIKNFFVNGPEVSCQIIQVSTEQYTGFKINTFKGDFRINKNELLVSNCEFTTNKSKAVLDFAFRYNEFKDYSDFFNKIRFDVDVKSSTVHMDDIACFAPAIKGMHNSLILNGKGEGPLNALKVSHCYVKYQLASFIAGDFAFFNILDFKNSSYNFQIKHSNLLLSELNNFYLPGAKLLKLPEMVTKMGTASVTGDFEGTINYFNTNLTCKTPLGNANITLETSPNNGFMDFVGSVATKDFQLGNLLENTKLFGLVNGNVQLTGSAAPFFGDFEFGPSLKATITGTLDQFDFCSYPIRNIEVEADYAENNYYAKIITNDKSLDLDFEGWIDLTESTPRYKTNLTLNNGSYGEFFKNYNHYIDTLNPSLLDNLVLYARQKPDLQISINSLDAEIKGNNLQNFTGFIGVNGVTVLDETDTATCDWMRINSIYLPGEIRKFILKGNILNANLTTNYKMEELGDSLVRIAAYYFPSLFPEYLKQTVFGLNQPLMKEHFVSLSVETFSTRRFLNIFVPGLRVAQNSTVEIFIGQTRDLDSISVNTRRVRWKDQFSVVNATIKGFMEQDQTFNLGVKADSVIYYRTKSNWDFRNIEINTYTKNQIVRFDFGFISPDTLNLKNRSTLTGFANLTRKDDIFIKISDSKVYLREAVWNMIGNNEIHFQKNRIGFDHF